MRQIVKVHYPDIKEQLLTTALTQFYEIREQQGLKKKPSTSSFGLAKVVVGQKSARGSETGRWKPIAQAAWRAVKERTGRSTV